MNAGQLAAATAWFAAFAALALLMGRSAWRDWHHGRREHDAGVVFLAIQQWWPAAIAAAMAVLVPTALALNA
jgi:hypothetical protein